MAEIPRAAEISENLLVHCFWSPETKMTIEGFGDATCHIHVLNVLREVFRVELLWVMYRICVRSYRQPQLNGH